MKSHLIALLTVFLMLGFQAKAQVESSDESKSSTERHEFMPVQGDLGVTLLLSGLIDDIQLQSPEIELGQNILFVRYYLEDDLSLRLGFGLDLDNYSRETADSVGLSLFRVDSSTNRFTMNISAGVEKHLKSTNRLDPYVFSQLNLTFIGKENTEVTESQTIAAGTARNNRTIKRDGGIGIGLVAGGGMNYFLAPRFSIGTEIGLIFQYSSIGGTITDNSIVTSIGGATNSDFNRSEDQVDRTEINVQTNALINISYFF